jgi:CelD/BcsL family acetyltransferase involved in cellulose biosynthesis
MLNVELITNSADWKNLRTEWNRLAGDRLCRRFDWLYAWWEANHDDYDLSIVKLTTANGKFAFLPLAKQRAWIAGDCLVWLGSGKACSDDMGMLSEEHDTEEAAVGFAKFLSEQSRGMTWDRLDLDGVRADDVGMNRLLDVLHATDSNTQTERRPSLSCWVVELKDDWQSQYDGFSKRVRKLFRQCSGFHEGKSLFEIAQTPEQAMEFLRDIESIHQSRWGERGISGCFSSTHFMEFTIHAIQATWTDEINRPYICRLSSGEVPIAGLVTFGLGDTLSVYLSGMNPEFSSIRPGWQMNFSIIQLAIERGYRHLDMMRGDEEYKAWLGGVPCTQERWIITASRWSSQLRGRVYSTAASVKHWATNFCTPAVSH